MNIESESTGPTPKAFTEPEGTNGTNAPSPTSAASTASKSRDSGEESTKKERGTSGRRGFAGMDAAKQREIARKGGRAAHERGTAHQFTPDQARDAGRRGGHAVSRDRSHMAEIGRAGGLARRTAKRPTTTP